MSVLLAATPTEQENKNNILWCHPEEVEKEENLKYRSHLMFE